MKWFIIFITIPLLAVFLAETGSSITEILRPNQVGTYTQWWGSTSFGAMLDNNNFTYVANNGSSAVGRNQTYNFVNHTLTGDDRINNVTILSISRRATTSSGTFSHIIKGGKGLFYTSATVITPNSTGYSIYQDVWLTDPGGGNWNATTINTLEAGVQLIASNNAARMVNTSEIWALVDYNLDPPRWYTPAKNETTVYQNSYVLFNATWNDTALGLAGYIFAINQTGNWINSSYNAFTGARVFNASTNITQITAAAGTNVSWYFWANDTVGNSNQTDIQSFVVSSCVYGGGNWALDCADNCIFETAQTIPGNNNITIAGTGVMNFSSGGKWTFTGDNQYITIESGCTLNIKSGGGFF